MIRALILDFDGLILDTETPMRQSWMEIYEEAGVVVDDQTWAAMLGASADPPEAYELLEKHLGRGVHRESLHERRLRRELEILSTEDLMPGVRSLVAAAKEAGLLLAIASSSERTWVVGHLESHDLLDPFDVIVCAEDVEQTKPAPDLYLRALEMLKVRPSEALVFEDSEHGLAAAKAAGIPCVAVPNNVTGCLAFEGAHLVVSALTECSLDEYITACTEPA